jgi:hypothetical protein
MDSSLRGPWVCSVCGSSDVRNLQPSLGDPRHPIGQCGGHQQKLGLTAMCRPEEWGGRRRRSSDQKPEDVFSALPDDERAALARPIKLL